MPPGVLVLPANYTCFSRSSGRKNITMLPWCAYTTDITTNAGGYHSKWFTNHTIARADLWWLCGDRKLRAVLPLRAVQYSCALVQLLTPFHIYPTVAFSKLPEKLKLHHRQKHNVSAPRALDNSIYTDAIEVREAVMDMESSVMPTHVSSPPIHFTLDLSWNPTWQKTLQSTYTWNCLGSRNAAPLCKPLQQDHSIKHPHP
ncbi:hypothetical protein AOLI_G00285890 [Acnodon oligacanthus]